MQSYENHAYRPVATGIGFLFVLVAMAGFACRWFGIGGRASFAVGLLGVVGALVMLLAMSRTYVTRLQDRIIKLEMRIRTATLLTEDQQRLLAQLSNKQVAALRFASDPELPVLLERTARERLEPDDIKRAIQTWVPDLDRT